AKRTGGCFSAHSRKEITYSQRYEYGLCHCRSCPCTCCERPARGDYLFGNSQSFTKSVSREKVESINAGTNFTISLDLCRNHGFFSIGFARNGHVFIYRLWKT